MTESRRRDRERNAAAWAMDYRRAWMRSTPLLKIVFYIWWWCRERVKEFERERSAAMERVARDAERLAAAEELPVDSFRARLLVVERENLEACVLRACASRFLKIPFDMRLQNVLLACVLRARTWRQWGIPQPVRTTQHSSRASERRPRPKSKMPGRVALGLGPLVTEEGYTSGSSDSRDTAERSKEAAVAQDALARRVQVSE